MDATCTDETDGAPVWSCRPGEHLVEGLCAVERLGVGTRCETWLAWSTGLWHPVVVKLARPHQVHHQRAVRSLGREVAALHGAPHPGLPRLLADGTRAALPHVVVEYVDGPTLAESLDEDGALEAAEAALLGAQLLPTVSALHARGLAHLDLKTENVVLRDGRPVLIDCGSARPIGSPQPAGHPVGTYGYVAPEMEACEPVSRAMDYYGLGTILVEALTGEPFPDAVPLPPTPLTGLVRRLLADDPDERGEPPGILLALASACSERPWPAWADRQLTAPSALAHIERVGAV